MITKKDYKVLISNLVSLSILQGLNIILPFLTFPFIIKKAGIDGFGTITYASTIVIFFIMLIEFGFNTIATREISVNIHNSTKIQKIFNDVISTKLMIFGACSIIFFLLLILIPKFRENSLIYFYSYLSTIGYVIFPLWLFHGTQKMKFVTYINVFYKTIFTICIFIFLKSKDTLWVVPLFNSLGLIASGITSIILAYKIFDLRFTFSPFNNIKEQLKSAFPLFSSELYVTLTAYTNILILGTLSGDYAVGIYSAAEKLIRAIGGLVLPIINTLFPYISNLFKVNYNKAKNELVKIVKYGSLVLIISIIILFYSSELIFDIVYKNSNKLNIEKSILVFKIMITFPLFSFIDLVFGRLVLLTNRREKDFFKVFSLSFIIGLATSLLLIYKFNYIGAAIANSFIQVFIAIGMLYYALPILKKNN
ncbi:oligosaccharide flippase family protein [Empedobacter brevis]|uniref:oligosaccharide flippase family protein n=1 Tax=Empedobacter brevis TaxID=247 RepID=UPI00039B1874|nr:oligosaccharide flippase family protein [Empedobacter brevis]